MKRFVLAAALALIPIAARSSGAQSPPSAPPPAAPPTDKKKPPARIGEITNVAANDTDITITMNLGTNDGIAVGWRGVVLDANDRPIRGSEFTVLKVTKAASLAKVKIGAEKLSPNNPVRLEAP